MIFASALSLFINDNLSQYISGTASLNNLLNLASYSLAGVIISLTFIFLFLINPIIVFIYSGILHLIVKIYRGRGSYAGTVKSIVYGYTPSILLIFVPIVNFALGIWSLIISVWGISANHEISKLRAFLVIITLPLIILIVILVLTLLKLYSA